MYACIKTFVATNEISNNKKKINKDHSTTEYDPVVEKIKKNHWCLLFMVSLQKLHKYSSSKNFSFCNKTVSSNGNWLLSTTGSYST